MKLLFLILFLLIPFCLLSQTNVIEPELHSDIQLALRDSTHDFIEHNGLVYTIADDGIHGQELWVFDKNYNSLRMVKDINLEGDSNPYIIGDTLDDVLIFYASDINGIGLWSTDGTENGTKLLKYLNSVRVPAGVLKDYWGGYQVFKGELYFSVQDSENSDYYLWKTDGTKDGTIKFDSSGNQELLNPRSFHVINDRLIFNASTVNDEIWSTDGTIENTIRISSGKRVYGSTKYHWSISPNYYFYLDSLDNKIVLYSTNGTKEGTLPLTLNFDNINRFTDFTLSGNNLFFCTYLKDGSLSLFITDGTIEDTRKLKTFTSNTTPSLLFTTYSNTGKQKLFFNLYENKKKGLWVSDGTEDGTIKISPPELENIYPYIESKNSDKLYWADFDDIKGEDLWVSDGTEEGTHFVKNLAVGDDRARIEFSTEIVNDKVLYFYKDEKGVNSIWVTDGTVAGTFILNSELRHLKRMFYHENVINNILYFKEFSSDNTLRFWQTDMTKKGTNIIMPKDQNNDIHVHEYFSFLIEYKNHIYFFADYYGTGQQLYRIPNTISSVEEEEPQNLLTLYPNPADDYIQIEIDKPMQLSIISSTGIVVKDCGIVTDGKVEVSELLTGVYFVVDEQGNNISKFVKE